jgi:ankyrin repeat protein
MLRSSIKDWFEFLTSLDPLFKSSPTAEKDFLDLESHLRPQLFAFIDCKKMIKARRLLQAEPAMLQEVLPDSGWTPLHLAANQGRIEFIRILIVEYGVDPNARSCRNQYTPLHQAAIGKSAKAVETLLDLGAHIDARVYHTKGIEYTTLELTVQYCLGSSDICQEYLDIIRVLLRRGADYLRDFNGITSSICIKYCLGGIFFIKFLLF